MLKRKHFLMWAVFPAIATAFFLAAGSLYDASAETVAGVKLSFLAKAEVPGESVPLTEIVTLENASPELVAALERIVVSRAPRLCQKKVLERAQLAAIMRRIAVKLDGVSVTLPEKVVLERPCQKLSTAVVRGRIESHLNAGETGGGYNVKMPVAFRDLVLPAGKYDLDVVHPATLTAGFTTFRMTFRFADGRNIEKWVNATIATERDVVVASRMIPPGIPVRRRDLSVERRAVASAGGYAFKKIDMLIGKILRRGVGYGEVVRKTDVHSEPDIKRGDQVVLSVRGASFSIKAYGTAQQSGSTGERIRVRNDRSRKVIVGKVVSGKIVEVDF